MKTLRNCLIILVAFPLVLAVLLYLFQEKITFFPSRIPENTPVPEVPGFKGEWVTFASADGTALSGLYLTNQGVASGTEPRWVVLYSHGNGGHLMHRLAHTASLASYAVDVFLYDYRGYGKSAGVPVVPGVIQDGQAAWKYLTVDRKFAPDHVILYGFSLGCGVTGEILRHVGNAPSGVIIESGFSSIAAQAARRFPGIGPRVLREDMSTVDGLKLFQGRLLVIHSRKDEVIDYEEGPKNLAASPSTKKTFLELTTYHHNDYVWEDPTHQAAMKAFFTDLGVAGL